MKIAITELKRRITRLTVISANESELGKKYLKEPKLPIMAERMLVPGNYKVEQNIGIRQSIEYVITRQTA